MTSLANPSEAGGAFPAHAKKEGGIAVLARAREVGSIADASLLTMYGIAHHWYGRHAAALEMCNEAARAYPEYPPAHAGRARALAGLGRPNEALQAFSDAIACDPKFAPAHADYALTLARLGCHEDAVHAYKEAIRLAPDSVDVHVGHAFALAGAERFNDAKEAYEKAVQLGSGSALPNVARGRVMAGTGRYSEALTSFERAVEIDPESASAHAGRGLALAALGLPGEALSAYETASRLDPGSASAHAGRGLVLEILGLHGEALSAYEKAVGIDEYHELARAGSIRTGRDWTGGSPGGSLRRGSPGWDAHVAGPRPTRGQPGRHSACSMIAACAMDPDPVPAHRYIEYCLLHAPRGGGGRRAPGAAELRSPPLTAEELSDITDPAPDDEAAAMPGLEFVDMIRRKAGIADGAGCGARLER